jgi:hypothetical protein
MQWILQDFEDTHALAQALWRRGLPHSWHKVVPFVGDLDPTPEIPDPSDVILIGSYTLWRYAKTHELTPGVYSVRPFLHEEAWRAHMLNGPTARVILLRDIPQAITPDDRTWFMRPVSDTKETAGRVWSGADLVSLAQQVLTVSEADIPRGSLRPDTDLMLCPPVRILAEWRIWIVADVVVTYSLYKQGSRVVYRPDIDDDARAFADQLVALNPGYAPAYVMDICRTDTGLHFLETNCLNAAGFYAADLDRLVDALEGLNT